jgi:hypothetical protein
MMRHHVKSIILNKILPQKCLRLNGFSFMLNKMELSHDYANRILNIDEIRSEKNFSLIFKADKK